MSARCHHEWTPDYVCTRCAAIKYSSAPQWATEVPIPCGPRSSWLALWSVADRDTVAPEPVYPGNARIGRGAGGVTPRTVQRHLEWLARAGWIRVVETGARREIELAWGEPRADWAAEVAAREDKIVTGVASDPMTILTDNASGLTDEASWLTRGGDDPVAHTLENLGSTLESGPCAAGAAASELMQDPPPQDTATPSPDDREDPQPAVTVQIADSSPPAAAQRDVSPPPSPATTKPRRRKAAPPKPGQTALGLADGPPPDDVAELLELHERLRADALRAHGEAVTGWPGAASKAGQALRRGLRQALAQRGADWCRAMLAWRSLEWHRDATQLAWSGHNVWSAPSIQNAIERMGRTANGRRSAGLLSAPPPSYDSAVHDYVPPDCGEEMKGF